MEGAENVIKSQSSYSSIHWPINYTVFTIMTIAQAIVMIIDFITKVYFPIMNYKI